jgi:hypothetical protein
MLALEIDQFLRRGFIRLQCDSREAEQGKLHRYSKTVVISAAPTNQTKILLAEHVMLDQAGPIYGYRQ